MATLLGPSTVDQPGHLCPMAKASDAYKLGQQLVSLQGILALSQQWQALNKEVTLSGTERIQASLLGFVDNDQDRG